MNSYIQSAEGYIVFEDGGISPIAYGACEKWFQTYDEAMKYAMLIVNERIEKFKNHLDCNSVIVYEGSEKLLHQTHKIPCGRIVFEWGNYSKHN